MHIITPRCSLPSLTVIQSNLAVSHGRCSRTDDAVQVIVTYCGRSPLRGVEHGNSPKSIHNLMPLQKDIKKIPEHGWLINKSPSMIASSRRSVVKPRCNRRDQETTVASARRPVN